MRVLILTGAGEKAFASGTDISQFRAFDTEEDAIGYEERIDRVLGAIERCPLPIIAAIAGACTGGGAGMAAACDMRIAAKGSRFGFPVARTLGILPVDVQLCPPHRPGRQAVVKDMVFTARLLTRRSPPRPASSTRWWKTAPRWTIAPTPWPAWSPATRR
ncbi:MAG: enoyl-CoA hydratase-related protein [Acetobacteraceae bacterium]